MDELREIAERNAKYAPTIPQSARVGCDVCPEACKWRDLRRVPVARLFRGYRRKVIDVYGRWSQRSRELTAEEDARAIMDISAVSCIVKRSEPAVQEAFFAFLEDESPIVRVGTARMLFRRELALDRAYATLLHVRDNYPYGNGGFEAGIALKIWHAHLEYEKQDPLQRAKEIMAEKRAR